MKLFRILFLVILSVTILGCATSVEPTEVPTPIPPTNTPVPPTDTPIPPTATPIPPTETPAPPTETPEPTATPEPEGKQVMAWEEIVGKWRVEGDGIIIYLTFYEDGTDKYTDSYGTIERSSSSYFADGVLHANHDECPEDWTESECETWMYEGLYYVYLHEYWDGTKSITFELIDDILSGRLQIFASTIEYILVDD